MTTISILDDGRFAGLPDPGPQASCPRVTAPCGAHTRDRFTWPRDTVRRLHPDSNGPRVLVIGKNPSCPDTATNSTLRPVLRVAGELSATDLALVNVLPVRQTELRRLAAANVDPASLTANRAVITDMLGWADIVIAAWGKTTPTEAAANNLLATEMSWLRATLAAHDDVRTIGAECHPYYWGTARLGASDLHRWHPTAVTSRSGGHYKAISAALVGVAGTVRR